MTHHERIGEAIFNARVARGLSQRALAREAGTDVSYISYLERGLKNPSLGVLLRILGAVGLTLHVGDAALPDVDARTTPKAP